MSSVPTLARTQNKHTHTYETAGAHSPERTRSIYLTRPLALEIFIRAPSGFQKNDGANEKFSLRCGRRWNASFQICLARNFDYALFFPRSFRGDTLIQSLPRLLTCCERHEDTRHGNSPWNKKQLRIFSAFTLHQVHHFKRNFYSLFESERLCCMGYKQKIHIS